MKSYYHPATGIYISLGRPFHISGVSYPGNWLELSTAEQIADIGIVEVQTVGARGDEGLFDNSEILVDGVLTITSTPKSQGQIIKIYESALDSHLDFVAQSHRYKDRFTFAIRAGYPGPYQQAGLAFAQWMDSCNMQAFELLQSVEKGTVEIPATPADLIALLPEFSIP